MTESEIRQLATELADKSYRDEMNDHDPGMMLLDAEATWNRLCHKQEIVDLPISEERRLFVAYQLAFWQRAGELFGGAK